MVLTTRLFVLLATAFIPSTLDAGRPGPLVPITGARTEAQLVEIGSDWQLSFDGAEPTKLPARELVYWGRYADNADESQILLSDGSILVADVLSVNSASLAVESPVWGIVELSLHNVRGILLAPPADAFQRDRLLQQIEEATGIDDRVLLANGDEVTGRVLPSTDESTGLFGINAVELERKADRPPLSLDVDEVRAILFAPALSSRSLPEDFFVHLGFHDGSLLAVGAVEQSARRVELQLVNGEALATDAAELWEAVAFIQPRRTELVYLSDLDAVGYKHLSFLKLSWPLQRDRNVLGGRLRTGEAVVLKGIGMHSASRATYELGNRFEKFQAEVALDERAGRGGSVRFRVFLQRAADDSSESEASDWQRAEATDVIRGGQEPVSVSVDLRGATRMALIVEFADRGDQQDYANWLNARLIPK